jgi:hypothetical protein
MAPVRKKSRIEDNDKDPDPGPAPDHQSYTNTTDHHASSNGAGAGRSTPPQQPPRGATWLNAASWKSKAAASQAHVALESISVDKGVSSESSSNDQDSRRKPSVSKSFRETSRKSIPLAAEVTGVHAVGDALSVPKNKQRKKIDEKVGNSEKPGGMKEPDEGKVAEEEGKDAPVPEETTEPPAQVEEESRVEPPSTRQTSGTWFGWWSRPDEYANDADRPKNDEVKAPDETPASTSPMDVPRVEALRRDEAQAEEDPKPEMSANKFGSTPKSWFGLWSRTQNEQAVHEERQRRRSEEQDEQSAPDLKVTAQANKTAEERQQVGSAEQDTAQPSKSKSDDERPKSSGWAFWSKERIKDEDTQKVVGELAVADTPSQSHPEAAQFNEERDSQVEFKRSGSLLRRGRKQKSTNSSGESTATSTPQGQTPAQLNTPDVTPEGSPAPVQRGKKVQTRPNLILPSFRDTYPTSSNAGYLDRLTQYLGSTLRLAAPIKPPHHPLVSAHPPKVRKAVAIGVHGFFPAALFQRVLGQPTGTSIRFANYAAASIKNWCQDHQPDIKEVEIEKVALEGEGLVADRVTTLWKLLLNWLSQLRQADFILVACHSQGVIVAIQLVAKLIQLGCLAPHARVGICAMAGINLGPFLEYKSRFFAGSALELFDFADRSSKVSIAYAEALDICLRHGVRITFVGGLDDQLVSLESSLHTPLSHPYIHRTVFVDGQLHSSNFLVHLVAFAAKLRNLGVSDHGLLREISAPLAGSIVGGAGHSRVYDDPGVYREAIEFALESTDVAASAFESRNPTVAAPSSPESVAQHQRKSLEESVSRRGQMGVLPVHDMTAANHMRRGSLGSMSLLVPPGIAPVMAPLLSGPAEAGEKNPFVLPWAVRGMLEEDLVRRDERLRREVRELVGEFEAWKPTSKVLRDVRWRLEGVRSML